MKSTICRQFEFHAAHKLPWYKGVCKQLHGHTYKLVVCVSGDVQDPGGPTAGMVMDFVELKGIVQARVLKHLDHAMLNEVVPNPTAENLVEWIWHELVLGLSGAVLLERVRLWETSDSYAERTCADTPLPEFSGRIGR